MGLDERLNLYSEIENLRGRPLLVYVTSSRRGASGSMASDVIPEFIDQLKELPDDTNGIDLLIESQGGDALVAWRVVSLIRERIDNFTVIIPFNAFSAATLLALGANEIIMGNYGCLGPIDPQINIRKKDGTTQQFAYQDVVSYLDFVKKEVGLTEQDHVEKTFQLLCEQLDPSVLGVAKRASSLSVTMAEKLLQTHMSGLEEEQQAKGIATKLNESYFSHGYAVSKSEAKDIGLKIIDADSELETRIWEIHRDISEEFDVKNVFDPIATFLNDPGAQVYLNSPPPVNFPPQTSPQMAQQIIQNHINQQLQANIPNVSVVLRYGVVESSRLCSCFEAQHNILLMKTHDLKFIANMANIRTGWVNRNLPTP